MFEEIGVSTGVSLPAFIDAARPARAVFGRKTDQPLHDRGPNRLGNRNPEHRPATKPSPPSFKGEKVMSDRVAFVTGGAQGIGQGISETWASTGSGSQSQISTWTRRNPPETHTDAGREAVAYQVDVTDIESVGTCSDHRRRLGNIQILG